MNPPANLPYISRKSIQNEKNKKQMSLNLHRHILINRHCGKKRFQRVGVVFSFISSFWREGKISNMQYLHGLIFSFSFL